MVTVLGVVLILLSGLSLGLCRAAALKRREDALLDLKGTMEAMRVEISFAARPLGETVRALQNFMLCRAAARFPNVLSEPQRALLRAGEELFTHPEDQKLFVEWAAGLGSTDLEGQLRHMDFYLARLEANLSEAAGERARKSKLYVYLGLCGALSLCIVLL